MIFVPTLIAALVTLVLKLASVVTISGWWILAIWPGIWLAWWLVLAALALVGFGIAALISKRQSDKALANFHQRIARPRR